MLHIVNKSSNQSTALQQCLEFAQEGDAVILIEGGVLSACKQLGTCLLSEPLDKVTIYVLTEDLMVRGLSAADCYEHINDTLYSGFVALVTQHSPVKSWF